MKVLKFGGTSVGSPSRMKSVAEIVTRMDGKRIVVLSALSGTTNELVSIGESLESDKRNEAREKILALREHYLRFYKELVTESNSLDEAQKVVEEHFGYMQFLCEKPFNSIYYKELLAQGELMSTKLFNIYLLETGVKSTMLPALEYMAINEAEEPDMEYITSNLGGLLEANSGADLFVTQGYICLNHLKQIDNLKRGGSDYTASLVGAAAHAQKVEIWTDIDGMHNNDPRIVDITIPIAELSFNEASELAYFGAKILHPSSILPAKQYNIPVQLKSTMDPDAYGTLISAEEKNNQIKAIAAKDGITAIKIKSTRMLLAYGFLRKVFEVFEKYRTPIDMITTSEVAISLTIDNHVHLDEIVEELNVFGEVTIDTNQTIVCIVGNMIAEQRGIVKQIFNSLEEIPIRMISYGGSKYNVSVLVESKHKTDALKMLNKGLFNL